MTEGSGSLVNDGLGDVVAVRSEIVAFADKWDDGVAKEDSPTFAVRRLGRCTASILSKIFPINFGW